MCSPSFPLAEHSCISPLSPSVSSSKTGPLFVRQKCCKDSPPALLGIFYLNYFDLLYTLCIHRRTPALTILEKPSVFSLRSSAMKLFFLCLEILGWFPLSFAPQQQMAFAATLRLSSPPQTKSACQERRRMALAATFYLDGTYF